MENLLESNERTLVMFDSVCSGLASCLVLVHTDIKQMTEHRNKLAQLEQEQIQAKLVTPRELLNSTNINHNNNNTLEDSRGKRSKGNNNKLISNNNSSQTKCDTDSKSQQDDDPHHLAGLKLLDKRLADSFSQAFSLNDQRKSSLIAKQQSNQMRPSIFQVLLGKSSWKNHTNNNESAKKDAKNGRVVEEEQLDNRMIIDDINRQTRLAMQYSKQLEAHLFKVEDLRSKYEMHLKMGLVVKSVARAYLTTGGHPNGSPSTLARGRHHCSSLVINDSSSMGTHSSLSSLNLSTWSSSRSKADKQARKDSNGQQMYVSTISLSNKHNKRLNLSKLISSTSMGNNNNKAPGQRDGSLQQQQHYVDSPTIDRANRRISSQSMEQQTCMKNYTYNDWPRPANDAVIYGGCNYSSNNNNNIITNNNNFNATTISKSSSNLNASHTSLGKGSGKMVKNQQSAAAAASSKTTIKEFIENIDRIEAEFESYMGSFLLSIEDIQGFARICQGDVFEISIKYGDTQKFKTKISVLKDNRQKCDNSQTVFKARIADVLAIKAYECKGLGKRVLLGHKLCETRDLFTARSQLMTISLNQTGSIKLNLIITWNPLHLTPNSSALPTADISHISLPPTPASSSTLSSLSSVPSMGGTTTTINIKSHNNIKQQANRLPINEKHPQHLHDDSMYQTVDPTYGYYIPPPDYLTNELKYREA